MYTSKAKRLRMRAFRVLFVTQFSHHVWVCDGKDCVKQGKGKWNEDQCITQDLQNFVCCSIEYFS